jgi:RHS repeat-associated protein
MNIIIHSSRYVIRRARRWLTWLLVMALVLQMPAPALAAGIAFAKVEQVTSTHTIQEHAVTTTAATVRPAQKFTPSANHPLPPGVTVYDRDPGYCSNPDPSALPVPMPYRELDPGPFNRSHTGPRRVFYVCTEGGDYSIYLEANAVGSSMMQEASFKSADIPPSLVISPTPFVYWEDPCGIAPTDSHQRTLYSGIRALAPGKYRVTLWVGQLFLMCTPDVDDFALIAFDINYPSMPFDGSLAPEDPCLVSNPTESSGDPVNTASGNFTHQEVDISIPTRGQPLAFERSYNSLDLASGALGRGWTHNYNMRLYEYYGDMVLVAPRGSRLYFEAGPGGAFTPKAGVRATLVRNPDNSYTLTRGDLLIYNFDASGRLKKVVDLNGNATVMDYEGDLLTLVTAPDGRTLSLAYDAQGQLIQITDPAGRVYAYAYTSGRLTSFTNPQGGSTSYTYDLDGHLAVITDALGRTLTNVYEPINNRVASQTDPLGNTTTFAFDPDMNQTTVTDARGYDTIYSYDHTGLRSITDELGNVTYFENDENFNLASVTDPRGYTTSYEWNDCGCAPTRVTDALGGETVYTYTPHGKVSGVKDARGAVTEFAYDTNGNLLTVVNPLGSTAAEFTYDADGQLLTTADPNGNLTFYGYDEYGNVANVTGALKNRTSFKYDLIGRMVSMTDALGRTKTFTYDDANHVVRLEAPLDYNITYTYDAVGNLIRVTDANNQTTEYTYDAMNRLEKMIDPLGNVWTYGYDAAGNLTSVTDSHDHNILSYEYDALNRLESAVDPLKDVTAYRYDDVGNLIEFIDANGRSTRYEYDELNRLWYTIDALKQAWYYSYDQVGNLLQVTDPNKHVRTYKYDELSRLIAEVDPLKNTWLYAHDNVGNLIKVLDANEKITYYGYDELNRLARIDYASSPDVSYSYDPIGNRLSMQDGTGFTYYTYDELYRLWKVWKVDTDTDTKPGVVVYDYDGVGNRTSLTYPDGLTIEYVYDAANRLIGAGNASLGYVKYSYDEANLLIQTDLPNETYTTYRYDDADRLIGVEHYYRHDQIDEHAYFKYSLDAVGNRLSMDNNQEGTTSYGYDALYRLTSVSTYPYLSRTNYTYDAVGNRLTITAPGTTVNYAYDDADRLTAVVNQDYAQEFSWDNNGNLLDDSLRTYQYDDANRLTVVRQGRDITSFVYNGDGDRMSKTVNDVTTNYELDVNTDLPVVLTEQTGTTITRYLYGLDLYAHQYANQFDSAYYYYHTDGLGSTRYLTDAKGTVTNTYRYDAFGASKKSLETTRQTSNFFFTGEQLDASTGLYYLRARYYSPTLGRFIQKDPFPGLLTQTQTLNPYSYVVNNPVNLTDPSGRIAPLLLAAGFGATIGGLSGGIGSAINFHNANPCLSLLSPQAMRSIGIGALSGAAGGFVAGLMPVGAGIGSAMVLGAVSGAAYGSVTQGVSNALCSKPLLDNLGWAAFSGAVSGTMTGAAQWGVRELIIKLRWPTSMLKPKVKDPKLAELVEELYRPGARIGNGSTADAIRHTAETGKPIGGSTHIRKGVSYRKALKGWIRSQQNNYYNPPSQSDIEIAQALLRDLQDALTRIGKP